MALAMKLSIFSVSSSQEFDCKFNCKYCSLSAGGDGGGDSLVLHLRGGARGPVRHPGGAEPGDGDPREGGGDQLQHGRGGEAGRHPVPAAAAADQ